MTRFTTMFLMSLALFTGACDDADDAPAADAVAAEGEGTQVEGAREGRRGGKFARLDVDKDGSITLAEAKGSRLEGKFAELDADKDGALTRDEMKAMKRHGKRHGGFGKDPGERAEMLLGKLDADKDGALSKSEMEARFKRHEGKFAEKFAERFTKADANADGKLTRDELAAMKGHGRRGGADKDPGKRAEMLLGKLDADKDGAISKAEMEARFKQHEAKFAEKFAERFTKADANADGKLSRDELAAMKGHGKRHGRFHKDPAQRAEMLLGKLDADKDGAISKTEVDGSRFAAKFAEVDANGDTRVTREELVAFRGQRGERGERRGR